MKNNTPNWDESRKMYLAYRHAKRKLNHIDKDCRRSYYQLENSFEAFMKAQTQALTHFEDESQANALSFAYTEFRAAKIAHDVSRNSLSEALDTFKDMEIAYSAVIFKGMQGLGFKIKDIMNVFGIWGNQITRWTQGITPEDLRKIYDTEYDPE